MAKQRTYKPSSGGKEITLDLGEANPKQAQFYASRTLYTAYGGARGGGKTHAVRIKAVGGAIRWPGIKVLIIRRTYPELQGNHIDPILKMVPREIASYNGTTHTLRFYNGSSILFGHFQGMSSEAEYRGQEYDWIFMDEATQFTEQEFRVLGGCLRGVNEIPKRFYLTCNPGGVGHRWVKRLFIDQEFKTESDNWEENENPDDYTFISATVEDNEAMRKIDPKSYQQYLQMLSQMPESMRAAHRYGDWSALGGTYFPEFSEAKHVIKPFSIPAHWQRYRAFDYGLDMLAVGWFAQDEKGRSYMYRELKMKDLIVSDASKLIHDNTGKGENIAITFAPPDMWNRQKDTGKTMAEGFMTSGIGIVKADNNRVQGWLQLKEMLADMPDGEPGLYVFNNCTEFIGDIQAIQSDEKNPNDCAKLPHDITHMCDAVRYYAISRTLKTEALLSQDEYEDDDLEDYNEAMTGGSATASYINY